MRHESTRTLPLAAATRAPGCWLARGRLGGRPRKMTERTLKMAMAGMSDPKANAGAVAKDLGMTTTTLYQYVNGDGTPKALGQAILDGDTAKEKHSV
jgi:hypothetical protein